MAYKSKLTEMMEHITDMNERNMEADLATGLSDDFSEANTAPQTPQYETPVIPQPTGTFADYARATMRLRRCFQYEVAERNRRGQTALTDVQNEALHRIAADMASILSYDSGDGIVWDSIKVNAELGKG